METCKACRAEMRMRYPGGDPENGPARLECKGTPAHIHCALCGDPTLATNDLCGKCEDKEMENY